MRSDTAHSTQMPSATKIAAAIAERSERYPVGRERCRRTRRARRRSACRASCRPRPRPATSYRAASIAGRDLRLVAHLGEEERDDRDGEHAKRGRWTRRSSSWSGLSAHAATAKNDERDEPAQHVAASTACVPSCRRARRARGCERRARGCRRRSATAGGSGRRASAPAAGSCRRSRRARRADRNEEALSIRRWRVTADRAERQDAAAASRPGTGRMLSCRQRCVSPWTIGGVRRRQTTAPPCRMAQLYVSREPAPGAGRPSRVHCAPLCDEIRTACTDAFARCARRAACSRWRAAVVRRGGRARRSRPSTSRRSSSPSRRRSCRGRRRRSRCGSRSRRAGTPTGAIPATRACRRRSRGRCRPACRRRHRVAGAARAARRAAGQLRLRGRGAASRATCTLPPDAAPGEPRDARGARRLAGVPGDLHSRRRRPALDAAGRATRADPIRDGARAIAAARAALPRALAGLDGARARRRARRRAHADRRRPAPPIPGTLRFFPTTTAASSRRARRRWRATRTALRADAAGREPARAGDSRALAGVLTAAQGFAARGARCAP